MGELAPAKLPEERRGTDAGGRAGPNDRLSPATVLLGRLPHRLPHLPGADLPEVQVG